MGDDMSEETKRRLLGGWWWSGLVDSILVRNWARTQQGNPSRQRIRTSSSNACVNSTRTTAVEWIRNQSSESDDWRAPLSREPHACAIGHIPPPPLPRSLLARVCAPTIHGGDGGASTPRHGARRHARTAPDPAGVEDVAAAPDTPLRRRDHDSHPFAAKSQPRGRRGEVGRVQEHFDQVTAQARARGRRGALEREQELF
jgi:hypothetical protein